MRNFSYNYVLTNHISFLIIKIEYKSCISYKLIRFTNIPNRTKPNHVSSHQLAGKINRTNDELKTTYQQLLPADQSKDALLENSMSQIEQPIPDSAFQVLLNLLREEGMYV